MSSNRLCMNLDMTKYLWFGTQEQLGRRDTVAFFNISAALVPDTATRNLGPFLDQELSMSDHITELSQVCFFYLRRIRVVRHSLTRSALLTLVLVFTWSRPDFCNSAMFGIYSNLLDRLQSILNAAARLLLQIPKFGSISSEIRDELHWLPVCSRIIFKQCLLVCSCFGRFNSILSRRALCPFFLPSLVVIKIYTRLRSASYHMNREICCVQSVLTAGTET